MFLAPILGFDFQIFQRTIFLANCSFWISMKVHKIHKKSLLNTTVYSASRANERFCNFIHFNFIYNII